MKRYAIVLLGSSLIFGVLIHQQVTQQEMSLEINQMQQKYDDQQTSISTVVRVLDEIREEKKEAERKAASIQDSLDQVRTEAQSLQQIKDSLVHVNNALKHEIKNISKRHDVLSPLEQRYRSRQKD